MTNIANINYIFLSSDDWYQNAIVFK